MKIYLILFLLAPLGVLALTPEQEDAIRDRAKQVNYGVAGKLQALSSPSRVTSNQVAVITRDPVLVGAEQAIAALWSKYGTPEELISLPRDYRPGYVQQKLDAIMQASTNQLEVLTDSVKLMASFNAAQEKGGGNMDDPAFGQPSMTATNQVQVPGPSFLESIGAGPLTENELRAILIGQ